MTDANQSHTLYRFFDADDRLLYVGRTINPAKRWRDHERKKPWFVDVATVRRQVYPDAPSLAAAELTAIRNERPLYNIQGNAGRHAALPVATIPVDKDWTRVAEARWEVWGLTPDPEHEFDETTCECLACHDSRGRELEELEDLLGFHPAIAKNIQGVRQSYIDGHDLMDWYYDLGDIPMFARMMLRAASQQLPIPTYVEFKDTLAEVWCPTCPKVHRFLAAVGDEIADVETSCGTRLTLLDDWLDALEARYEWGERADRTAVA